MSLRKRGLIWHYDFQCMGVRFQGSTFKTDKKAAKAFEAEVKRVAKAEVKEERRRVEAAPAEPAPILTIGELAKQLATERRSTRTDAEFFDNLAYITETLGPDLPVERLANEQVCKLIVAERLKGLLLGRLRRTRPGPVEPLIPADLLPKDASFPLAEGDLAIVLLRATERGAALEKPRYPLGSASIRHNILKPIKALVKLAHRRGVAVPRMAILSEKAFDPYTRHRILSHEEELRLRLTAPPERMAYYDFALQSMLRLSNIIHLTWQDVDLASGEIHVHVKGGAPFYRHVNAKMDAILRSRRGRHPEHVFTKRRTEEGRVREMPLSKYLNVWFREDCERAGIRDLRFHDLRRTGATRMYAASRDIREVQYALGHADVETTWAYVVRTPGDRERAERLRAEGDRAASEVAAREVSASEAVDPRLADMLTQASASALMSALGLLPELRAGLASAFAADAGTVPDCSDFCSDSAPPNAAESLQNTSKDADSDGVPPSVDEVVP